jgi:cell division initiation protein
MIDLTPLDVRNKRGDFKRLMRGYDPQEVDVFLELVAERMEALTRENIGLRERAQTLQQQVSAQSDREQAVQEALVTAQELRADIRGQAQREAEGIVKEAQTEARRLVAEAEAEARTRLRSSERRLDQLTDALAEIERRRARFLNEFRHLLERELDVVQVEEDRQPHEDRTIELELGARSSASRGPVPPDAPVDELAAAHERIVQADAAPTIREASLADAMQEAPPPPRGRKEQDSLMLYPESEEDA